MALPDIHARTHLPGGTDPITFPAAASALGRGGLQSISITGSDLIGMVEMYATPGFYAPDTGDPLDFQFINLLQDGYYCADFMVFWTTIFGASTGPNLEPACQIGGTPDTLVNSVIQYWDNFEGWIGGEQLDAGELAHHQLVSRVCFNYRAADIDPDFGIGVRLKSSATGFKSVGCGVAVTRLGDALEEVT